jgi:hypothetical protein
MTNEELLYLAIAIVHLAGSALAGFVADARGRHGISWFCGAFFLFTPLLGLLALAALPETAWKTPATGAASPGGSRSAGH